MPLITLCGFPRSGKSTRALELKSNLESDYPVEIITTDETLDEKNQRAMLLSKIEKSVTKTGITIIDYTNHIKGLRYQIHCIAKNSGTSCCTVYCAMEGQSTEDTRFQFEEPSYAVKWDTPLFTLFQSDRLPLQEIKDALEKTATPNFATVVKPFTDPSYRTSLSSRLQQICSFLVSCQKDHRYGMVEYKKGVMLNIPSRAIGTHELGKWKKLFGRVNSNHTIVDLDTVDRLFVEYLNGNL